MGLSSSTNALHQLLHGSFVARNSLRRICMVVTHRRESNVEDCAATVMWLNRAEANPLWKSPLIINIPAPHSPKSRIFPRFFALCSLHSA
jgi:hypothetical protein